MAYSHCTGPGQVQGIGQAQGGTGTGWDRYRERDRHRVGLGQVQGTVPGAMDTNMLYRNVHTGPRQGKEPGSIVSY